MDDWWLLAVQKANAFCCVDGKMEDRSVVKLLPINDIFHDVTVNEAASSLGGEITVPSRAPLDMNSVTMALSPPMEANPQN